MRNVDIAGRRTAAQRTLRNCERERIHHPHEGDDAAGLAIEADRFADPADIAPIGADAAALRGEPDVLVPGVDDAVEAVRHAVEIAGNRQAARGAAVRQHGRGGHEPQVRDIVVKPLRMFGIVGEVIGHTREQVLVAFARQQVTIGQRFLAEFGQQRIAALVGLHVEAAIEHLLAVMLDRFRGRAGDRAGQRLARRCLDQFVTALVRLVHGDRFLFGGGFGRGVLCVEIQCHRRIVPALEIHRVPRRLSAPRAAIRPPAFRLCSSRRDHCPAYQFCVAPGRKLFPFFPTAMPLGRGSPIWGAGRQKLGLVGTHGSLTTRY